MEIYLIKVNASIILFYLCYKLLFQRDTFWMVRRIYLLIGVLFSFVYPLFSMEGWLKKQEPIMTAIAAIQLDEFVITPDGASRANIFTLENVLWMVFGLIALLLFVRIGIQLFSIIKRRIQGTKTELQGVPVIKIDEKVTPFSFFQWIFINPSLHTPAETAEILEHEQTHARQWHSIDVIIGQVQKMLCWFNPAAWLMEREIRHNLEFLADNQVLKSGFEPKKYQYHLLSLTYEPADSKLGNQFNVSPIKKRIKMMNSKKTKKTGLLKYALIIPIALVMLIMSTMQDMIAATQNTAGVQAPPKQKMVTSTGTVIEIQEVPENTNKKGVETVVIKEYKSSPNTNLDELVVVGYGSQEKTTLESDLKDVYEVVETPPVFPGGEKALFEYLSKNIQYPVEAQKQKIDGRVTVQFIVNDKGKVIHPRIVKRMDPLLEAEALRIINSMPNWTPGKQNGKNVSVRYTLPIMFRLDGVDKTESSDKNPSGKIIGVKVKDSDTQSKSTTVIDKNILVILDGKEIPKEKMNEIDPKTIESLSVLKDQAAVELYGEKGRNGVIIITSKE